MRFILLLCIANLCLTWKLSDCAEIDIEQVFKNHSIVPDVVDVAPTETMDIFYRQKKEQVREGNELAPVDVDRPPEVSFKADPDSYYVLTMLGPDEPNRTSPALRCWKHWLVVNIPGANYMRGEEITSYMGTQTPKNSGWHRYVFLVYKQPSKLEFHKPDNYNRSNFSIKDFASKHNLGNPVAGNFFFLQNPGIVFSRCFDLTSP